MQKCEISKNCHFFAGPQSSKTSISFSFYFLESLWTWMKTSILDKCKNSLIWRQNTQKREISKIHSFESKICKSVKLAKIVIFSQVRSHRKLQFIFLFIFWKVFEHEWKHQYLTNVKIHSFGGKIRKNVKLAKFVVFAGPWSSKTSIVFFFFFFFFFFFCGGWGVWGGEAFENEGKYQYLTSGQMKCKGSLIWMQNMQKCKLSKNYHFLQVRSHRKLPFYIFWKTFENEETHQYLTSGQLKRKNSLIWRQNMQKASSRPVLHFYYVS